MNVNSILKWIGGFFTAINPNDILEDLSLLAAAVATFHMTPFDMATAPTWLAMGAFGKSVISILSNLKVQNQWIQFLTAIVAKLNDQDTVEDAALFAAAVKALTIIPMDFHNAVFLMAAGAAFKAGLSLLQQLGIKSPTN